MVLGWMDFPSVRNPSTPPSDVTKITQYRRVWSPSDAPLQHDHHGATTRTARVYISPPKAWRAWRATAVCPPFNHLLSARHVSGGRCGASSVQQLPSPTLMELRTSSHFAQPTGILLAVLFVVTVSTVFATPHELNHMKSVKPDAVAGTRSLSLPRVSGRQTSQRTMVHSTPRPKLLEPLAAAIVSRGHRDPIPVRSPGQSSSTSAAPIVQEMDANLNITAKNNLWAQAGKRWGVDPLLIYSVALVESRALQSNGNIAPTPWVARINQHLIMGGQARVQDALALADRLSVPIQDVGIMQIYYPLHRDMEPNPVALLDPLHNVMIGTEILLKGMRETHDPVLAVGYYHSHNPELARYYGRAVLTVYQRLRQIYPQVGAIADAR